MHELSVTENILDIASKQAEKEAASKVTDIYLVIGHLSSIVDDSVQFYWDIITKDTICEGSTLHFERIQAKFRCNSCKKEFNLDDRISFCPECKSNNITLVAGDEFRMDSIEIEK
jgi:hydrogenase nickel incorporation protein HypA/HybF